MKKRKIKYGWYIIASIMHLWFGKVPDGAIKVFVELIIIVAACFFYYWLKKRINLIKIEFINSVVLGFVSIILFSFLGIVMFRTLSIIYI